MSERRKHRRVDAPPTGGAEPDRAGSEGSADPVGSDDPVGEREAPQLRRIVASSVERGSAGEAPLTAHEKWIVEQRPPHWG